MACWHWQRAFNRGHVAQTLQFEIGIVHESLFVERLVHENVGDLLTDLIHVALQVPRTLSSKLSATLALLRDT